MTEKTFFKASWCDFCGGILVGSGFKCLGPCGQKCHRGNGNGTFHCHAGVLQTVCEHGAGPQKPAKFKLRDIPKQMGRDLLSFVKEQVVTEVIREQRKLGHFNIARSVIDEIRTRWENDTVAWILFALQLGSAFALYAVTYIVTLLCAWPVHGERGWRLACVQAIHSANLLIMFEGALCVLAGFLSRQVMLYSAVVEAFCKEILFVNPQELNIDLMEAGAAVDMMLRTALPRTLALGVCAVAIWLREVWFA